MSKPWERPEKPHTYTSTLYLIGRDRNYFMWAYHSRDPLATRIKAERLVKRIKSSPAQRDREYVIA